MMDCPYCKYPGTRILYTLSPTPYKTKRRRECIACSKRFWTQEEIIKERPRERAEVCSVTAV